jgi:hypothetical protein
MDRFELAIDDIDAANGADPGFHDGRPLALSQGRRAMEWVESLQQSASDPLRLAARAHHLRRWLVPRLSYPEGRAGYLRWRRDQKMRHAAELTEILLSRGFDQRTVERAAEIVTKSGLGSDPEVQVFEDAVSLTFIETQLISTVQRVGPERAVEIIARTLEKMSEAGRSAALTIELDDEHADLINRAIAELAAA